MKQLQHFLWQLPMLLGASTLLSYSARAAIPDAPGSKIVSAQTDRAGQVALKLKNNEVYFSQDGGRHFERLPATPEAVRLKGLLQAETRSGAGNVLKVSPTVVADGAGGFQWARPKDTRASQSASQTIGSAPPPQPVANPGGAVSRSKEPTRTRSK